MAAQKGFTYKRTQGDIEATGLEYENKVALLLYFRGKKENYNFNLGTGVKDAGKFDDVVFNYSDGMKHKTILLQLKHKKDPNSKNSKREFVKFLSGEANRLKFSVQKLYKSFCEIKVLYDKGETPKWWEDFESFQFVLFTNVRIDTLSSIASVKLCKDDILNTNGCVYNLNDEAIAVLNSDEIDKCLTEEFMEKFVLYANQTSEHEMMNIIQNEVADMYKVSVYGACEILNDVLSKIRNLRGSEVDCDVITEKCNVSPFGYRENIISSVNKNEINSMIHLVEGIQLERNVLEKLKTDLESSRLKVNVVENAAPIWCYLLIYKSFITIEYHPVIVTLQTLGEEETVKQINKIWPSDWCRYLIILVTSKEKKLLHNLYNKFAVLLKNATDTSKIILVTESLKTIDILEDKYNIIHLQCDFRNLTSDSKTNVLQKTVNFQGNFPVILKDILPGGTEAENILDSQCLNELLLQKETVEIGKNIKSQNFYINRKVVYCSYMSDEILKAECNDIFALSGKYCMSKSHTSVGRQINFPMSVPFPIVTTQITKQPSESNEKLCYMVRYSYETLEEWSWNNRSLLNSPNAVRQSSIDLVAAQNVRAISNEKDYRELCNKYENVHWLEGLDNILKWKETKGDISIIQKYNLKSGDCHNIWDVPGKITLLIADAGMGKTTFLYEIAYDLKVRDPHILIIHLRLIDTVPLLQKLQENKTNINYIDDNFIVDFLLSSDQQSNSYIWRKICHSLNTRNKTVILIDGFDEIIPMYEETVLSILLKIVRMNCDKIWITSRTNGKQILEKTFKTLSCTLEPFQQIDQREFLLNCWQNEEFEKHKIRFCIKRISHIFRDKTFLGIPLHCEIVAEVFKTYLEKHITDFESEIVKNADELYLYETFIKRKFHYYCNKYEHYSKNCNVQNIIKQWEEFVSNHMHAAIQHTGIFHYDEKFQKILKLTNRPVLKEAMNGEKTGLISYIHKEFPQFVHTKIAEFFAAKYLFQNILQSIEKLKDIMRNPNGNFFGIRHMLNLLSIKDLPLHKAVYALNVDEINNLLNKQDVRDHIEATDAFGRTVLHIAVGESPIFSNQGHEVLFDTVKKLLNHGADIKKEDKITNNTPFQYLHFNLNWSLMEIFLETKSVEQKHTIEMSRFLWQDVDCIISGIEYADPGESKTLLNFLLKSYEPNQENRDMWKFIQFDSLVLAVCNSKTDMLTYLIEYLNIDWTIKAEDYSTILHWACLFGNKDAVQYLVEKCKMNPNLKNLKGTSTVGFSALRNQLHILKYFHEEEKVNMKEQIDNSGRNLLFLTQDIKCVKYLVEECGIDPKKSENKIGKLPIHKMSANHLWEIVYYYIDKCNINVNVTTVAHRSSVLHCACMRDGDITEFIEKYRKKIQFDATDVNGVNPFFFAVAYTNSIKVAKCIANHSNTNCQDREGNTCLHYILLNHSFIHLNTVVFLVEECDVNPSIRNNNDETAIDIAEKRYRNDEEFKKVIDYSVIEYLKRVTK